MQTENRRTKKPDAAASGAPLPVHVRRRPRAEFPARTSAETPERQEDTPAPAADVRTPAEAAPETAPETVTAPERETVPGAETAPEKAEAGDAGKAQPQNAPKAVAPAENKKQVPAKGGKKVPAQNARRKKGPPPKKHVSTGRLALQFFIKLFAIAAAVWAVFTFVFGIHVHYGNNMHPAVNDGDLVITYRLQKPVLNGVVMYKRDGRKQVGRVIALGGSKVSITENGELTVNGVLASEETFYPTVPAQNSGIEYPYTVPEGCVFLLNDMRTDTVDSRVFGAVPVKDLQGNVLLQMRRRGF